MKTTELLKIIGPFNGDTVLTGHYGNGRVTKSGYLMADPCYIGKELPGGGMRVIQDALRAAYPWEGYDYNLMRSGWQPLYVSGMICWTRDTGGDGNLWGCNVDSGCLIVAPLSLLASLGIQPDITIAEETFWPEPVPTLA